MTKGDRMSLRSIHVQHENMKRTLDQDPTTTPKARATLTQTVRARWMEAADALFKLMPASLMPLASEFAWNVFDNNAPGPLADLLVATVSCSATKGHVIHIKQERFAACGATDMTALSLHIHNLNEAWKDAGVHILIRSHNDGAEITFFSF